MNAKLTKYEVKPSELTLTIELVTGEEVTVSISAHITEQMIDDYYTVTFPDGPHPYAAKITRTYSPDGSMPGLDEDATEYEEEED